MTQLQQEVNIMTLDVMCALQWIIDFTVMHQQEAIAVANTTQRLKINLISSHI